MKGFMSQLASGAVGKNLQEGLGSLANKAQGLAQGLAQNLPKPALAGAATQDQPRATANASAAQDSQLQLQEPYSADEEGAVLRQQVVQLQVKNGMLQAELEEARSFAEEAARLRGVVSDLETKLLFALKGTAGMEPLLPRVIEEQQQRIDDLTATLAARDGEAAGLRADNARLRCKVEDLMSSMAASARHAETTHNEHLRSLQAQLQAVQEEVQLLRASALGGPSEGGDGGVAVLRAELQHARDVIKELEEETEELRRAADEARAAAGRAAGSTGGGVGGVNVEALEWRVAELEEQLEEANERLKETERKGDPAGPPRFASTAAVGRGAEAAVLQVEVETLRGELTAERSRMAEVAGAAAAEAAREGEAALRELQKRLEALGKECRAASEAREAAEKRAAGLEGQLAALQLERQRAVAAAEAAATAVATAASPAPPAEAEAAVARLQSELDAAVGRAASLEQKLASATERCMTLEQQLKDAKAKAASELAEQERGKDAVSRGEVAEARARADALAAQLAEAQRSVAAAEQRSGELAADLLVTQRKLESATERIVLYTEREHEAEQIVAIYGERQAEIEQLRQSLALAEEELAAARVEAERSQEQAQLAGDTVAKLRARLDKISERRTELEAQVEELQGKLQAARTELQAVAKTQISAAATSDAAVASGSAPTVSMDTSDLPKPDMPSASTDTAGLPKPEMSSASTDTAGLVQESQSAASLIAETNALSEQQRNHQLVSELLTELSELRCKLELVEQQLAERDAEFERMRTAVAGNNGGPAPTSAAEPAAAEAAPAPAGIEPSGAAEAQLKASQADGWEQDENDWDAWSITEAVAPAQAAAAAATASLRRGRDEARGCSDTPEGAADATGLDPSSGSALAVAEARLSAYASELSLLQDTIRQLLGSWTGASGAAASANGSGKARPERHDHHPGDDTAAAVAGPAVTNGAEAAVLGSTVVALLEQLRAHFQHVAALREQLNGAEAELQLLRSEAEGGGVGPEGQGQAHAQQRLEEIEEEITHMMQDMAAAEQRAQAAEAAAAAAASWRQQLEQQLQHSDESAASAEASVRQLTAALEEQEACAAELGRELEAARNALAAVEARAAEPEDLKAALAAAEAALADAKDALASAAVGAEARAAEVAMAASAAEVQVKELQSQLVDAQRAAAEAAAAATDASTSAPSSFIPAEHLGLMRQIAAAAQAFAPLFHAVKASRGGVDELSHKVAELEALSARLEAAVEVAGDSAAAPAAAPPTYEQSFESRHIGPAGAASLAAAAAVADGHVGAAATAHDAGRAVEDSGGLRLKLEAAEAAARAAQSEVEVLSNVAESLRVELRDQQVVAEALRQSMVAKDLVAAMEASYQGQLQQLQASLGRAADKQARQFAALEEEHSQALAEAEARRAAEVAASIKAAEARVPELEALLEEARRGRAEAAARAEAAEAVAEEARRTAADIERGWGERVERLQKINKKRAAELDEARAESSGLSEKLAAVGERVTTLQAELMEARRQLESEQAVVSELRVRLESLTAAGDSAGQEVSGLRARAEAAEARRAELEQRAAAAEARLLASEADRSKLADQLVLLHSLREERAAALSALAEARGGLSAQEALRVRCESAEAARDRAAAELTRITAMMSNLEARLQQVEDENESLVSELDEERRRGAALARSWAGELEALPGLPRERWPAAVRRLVDGLESRAGADNASRALEHQGHARELEALRELVAAAEDRAAHADAEAAAAGAALRLAQQQADQTRGRLEAELRAELAQQLEEMEAAGTQMAARVEVLEAEVVALRGQLRGVETANADLQEELQRLREKSRALLEEKDVEADQLRVQLRQARAAVAAAGSAGAAAAAAMGEVEAGGLSVSSSQTRRAGGAGSALASSSSGGALALAPAAAGGLVFGAAAAENLESVASLRSQIATLQHELQEYKHAYEDAESTHKLRDTAQAALREELARLQAQVQLSSQDVQYLRAAIISFFESGSLPREGPVMQVLSRLLRFTPAEVAAIAAADHAHRAGGAKRNPAAGSGAAPAPLMTSTAGTAAHGQSAAGGLPAIGLLASVTSKVASAVSSRIQQAAAGVVTTGAPSNGGGGRGASSGPVLSSASFGQRPTPNGNPDLGYS